MGKGSVDCGWWFAGEACRLLKSAQQKKARPRRNQQRERKLSKRLLTHRTRLPLQKLQTNPLLQRLERPEIAASCRRAQFWYYKDTYNQLQGPFYPGELHDWFAAKHFLPSQMMAPSFQGEVPQDFYRIEQLFDLDAAFHCDSDVAWKPPEEPPPPEPELSDAELQQMLKDRLLNTNNRNGPVFAGKWVDN